MKDLNTIFKECGADKSDSGHGYAKHYEKAFGHLRYNKIKLLEIGVGGGESIRGWLEFLPNAHIYGCDVVSGTNSWNTHYPIGTPNPEPRYDFLQGDQADPTMWACYLAFSGVDFNIVIDDGGHFNDQVITTFGCLWPTIVPGGFYCIEDLAVGSTQGTVFLRPGFPSHMDWLKGLQEKMHLGENDIAEIHLSKELAILRKRE
jgi:hypothetical protein